MSKFSRTTVLSTRPIGRPLRWISPITRSRLRTVRCNADDPENFEGKTDDAEERIAQLEAAARGAATRRRRFVPDKAEEIENTPTRRRWKEGEAFPEGWNDLNAAEKVYELYVGERGLLYWVNRVAFAALVSLGVSWVLFRFVGPLLGLYELRSNLSP